MVSVGGWEVVVDKPCCQNVSMETQKCQVQSGTVWSFGTIQETLSGADSTTSQTLRVSLDTCSTHM
jgi:hypothetical protein